MTSFGATNIISDGFMPTFKVQGQVYHLFGSLLPPPDDSYKFLQIYFMSNNTVEADQRCDIHPGTKPIIISELQNLLHKFNHLVKLFQTSLEQMPTDDYKVVIKADKTPSGEHERRFNAPTIDEVAIVMVGTEFDRRDIVICKRNKNLKRVSETHRSYDALQYPILFWKGEDGYHFNVMQTDPGTGSLTSKKVSFSYIFIKSFKNIHLTGILYGILRISHHD